MSSASHCYVVIFFHYIQAARLGGLRSTHPLRKNRIYMCTTPRNITPVVIIHTTMVPRILCTFAHLAPQGRAPSHP